MSSPIQPSQPGNPVAHPRSSTVLWLVLLGPPVIWLTQFQVRYSLAARLPRGELTPSLTVVGVISLILVAVLGVVAIRECRAAGANPLDTFAGTERRIRFMAMLGAMSSGLFFLVIVAQLLAELFNPGG